MVPRQLSRTLIRLPHAHVQNGAAVLFLISVFVDHQQRVGVDANLRDHSFPRGHPHTLETAQPRIQRGQRASLVLAVDLQHVFRLPGAGILYFRGDQDLSVLILGLGALYGHVSVGEAISEGIQRL